VNGLDAALLAALRSAPVYSGSSELAAQLASTLPMVESRIEVLRSAGFEIDERPGLGYRLVASPDRLIADDLFSRLGPSSLVREIVVFNQTDSTNDQAAQLARDGAQGGLVIFAERQNAGRGRFGRRWASASHVGLWFSILLRPRLAMLHWPRLTTAAAVSMASAIEKTVALRPEIKWPNDLQVEGKKIAGILMEAGTDRAQQPFAVLGMGVNVNQSATDFPEELAGKASSLKQALGQPLDRPALAVAILRELESRLDSIETGFAEILQQASSRSALLGRWIEVSQGAGLLLQGRAEALDAEGHLLLKDANGTLHRLAAGEVTILGWS
jgi:BirA family transcriptional regulator, biotin operon repressor / biotin---[acetyl-CoA-carboxylase] ligase